MASKKGKIGVSSENIFPIIKKFLYSEHDIFLRELVSNAVDATQKLKILAAAGEVTHELSDARVYIEVDEKNKTILIRDHGIGMTEEEVKKYINQIAFSSAGDFLEKYKNDANAIIGHFGLGFYSAFMVSEKVEIITRSFRENAQAVLWSCTGDPEYTLKETEKDSIGTDVILHIDKDSEEFLEKNRISSLLNKYCKFLPVEIVFGKKTEWKDGKETETDEWNVINNTQPVWTKKPADLKDEDYAGFYRELYPYSFEEPLFNIHLNVDYPFNLTGVLYFPKIKSNIDIQKNKIQLYCNQVFVTDSVEGIVPEFLTLLHGVIDSPDIPLNVSRSYLQNDANVKKISGHISKKVSDRLAEIFKNDRADFEKKWDDLKLFIIYGMITDEKFYERAEKFSLLKNTDGKYFTFEEYKQLIELEQTDKNKTVVYLYATDSETQFSYIQAAKNKGYDVLLFDGQLDMHFINHLETKFKNSHFVRVDAETADNLVKKEKTEESKLSELEKQRIRLMFEGVLPENDKYIVGVENMNESDMPVLLTRDEFMRRMKDMSHFGSGTSFYRDMPDSFRLVVNSNHSIIVELSREAESELGETLIEISSSVEPLKKLLEELTEKHKGKKDADIPAEEKEQKIQLQEQVDAMNENRSNLLHNFGKSRQIISQLFDLALLSNNMLKGEALTKFVNRSLTLMQK
ncbi:MAG TPA: molecular chaperone HtpG [Bacteroidales bacterium]|nr:molecular chaperone HtpG [Bacteroidales bacterium]